MRFLYSILLCLLLLGVGKADDTLALSKEDAKQLHAFLLRVELLNFGDRAKSASAYLMAAELFLDYPPGEVPKERIVELAEKAQGLADGDEFLEAWVERILLRSSKIERGLVNQFEEKWISLEPGGIHTLSGEYKAAWIRGERTEIQILDKDGRVLETGQTLTATAERAPYGRTWQVKNKGESPQIFRLLLLR